MKLTPAEILFPNELHVTDTNIEHVLIVGSCGAFNIYKFLRQAQPTIAFDFLGTNNVDVLPVAPPRALEAYAFQFIQIALREVLTDTIVQFKAYISDPAKRTFVLDHAQNAMRLRLASCLEYNRQYGLLSIVSNFPVPQRPACASLAHVGTEFDLASVVRDLNQMLVRYVAEYENVYVMDWDGLTSALGKPGLNDDLMNFYAHASIWDAHSYRHFEGSSFDNRLEPTPAVDEVYVSHLPEMIDCLWRQWLAIYRTAHQIDAVKMVIFDLDDTLWRGQIAEHYGDDDEWPSHDGWPTGIWEAIHHLRARGILVAIASKNEATLVRQRWDRGIRHRWLALEDFAFAEINWQPKAVTVARMIKSANLTPRSVLFIDDNPSERDSVRLALPGIRVLGDNPLALRRVLLWSSETQVARLSDEAVRRESMIRAQGKREEARAAMSREEFLQQLDCRIRLFSFTQSNAPSFHRCLELINKTNQFNTTGRRWSPLELARFLVDGGRIFAFDVHDRYTDYGLVGTILYREGRFEQFAMSCRVLGLDIETAVIHAILDSAPRQIETFTAQVVPTEANMVCREVYTRCGFSPIEGMPGSFTRGSRAAENRCTHLKLVFQDDDIASAA